jgi:HlyD family secretion protein
MSSNALFRQSALERLSTPDRLDTGLSVVGSASWALIWGIIAFVVGGLVWAVIVVVPVTVKGQGILLNPGGVLDVTSGSQGRVLDFAHHLGETVKKGEVIATIDQPQLRQELAAAEGDLRDALDQRERTADFQKRRSTSRLEADQQRRQALNASIKLMTENSALYSERVDLHERFANEGLTTRDKYLESKLELGRQREELSRSQVSLQQIDDEEIRARTDDEKEMLTLDLHATAAQRHVDTLQQHLKSETEVHSPYTGTIAEIKVNPGELVDRGMPLFTIIPISDQEGSADNRIATDGPNDRFGALTAILYVPPSYGKQVHAGDQVEVAVSTARREEFGFVLGRVRAVADIPSTTEGMLRTMKNKQLVQNMSNNAAPFEVVVDLYADPATPSGYRWSSSRGPDLKLNEGTLIDADVEVRSLPILSLVVPQFRQLLDELRRASWFGPAKQARS